MKQKQKFFAIVVILLLLVLGFFLYRIISYEYRSIYCFKHQVTEQGCPEDHCRRTCGSGGDGFGCSYACAAKSCSDYKPEDCPKSDCILRTNYDGEIICQYKPF